MFIGLSVSVLVLIGSCVSVIITLLLNEGVEKAQFGYIIIPK
jgi:hypothetical protein